MVQKKQNMAFDAKTSENEAKMLSNMFEKHHQQ